MPFTFTNNPTDGGNPGGWGLIINNILNELKTACNNLLTDKANSTHGHADLATAQALADAVSTLETAINGKAASGHEHTDLIAADAALQGAIDTINNTLQLITPNLAAVNVTCDIAEVPGGIRIKVLSSQDIFIRRYNFSIKKGGAVIFDGGSSMDTAVITPDLCLTPFSDGDILEITGQIVAGNSFKDSAPYSITYDEIISPAMESIAALQAQLNTLTIPAIVAEFKGDEDAMQELANGVHGSNTLAQKVYELGVN